MSWDEFDASWDEYILTLKNPDGSWNREALGRRSQERQEMHAARHDELPTQEDREFIVLVDELVRPNDLREPVGPLEQAVLETLCGKGDLGPWPPAAARYRAASELIEEATGERPSVFEVEVTEWTDDDWVDFLAGLARKSDEKTKAVRS